MTPSPDKPVEMPKPEGTKAGERLSPKALFVKARKRVGATKGKLRGVLTSLSRTAPNVDLSPERAEFAQQEQTLADLDVATAGQLGVAVDQQQTAQPQANEARAANPLYKAEITEAPKDWVSVYCDISQAELDTVGNQGLRASNASEGAREVDDLFEEVAKNWGLSRSRRNAVSAYVDKERMEESVQLLNKMGMKRIGIEVKVDPTKVRVFNEELYTEASQRLDPQGRNANETPERRRELAREWAEEYWGSAVRLDQYLAMSKEEQSLRFTIPEVLIPVGEGTPFPNGIEQKYMRVIPGEKLGEQRAQQDLGIKTAEPTTQPLPFREALLTLSEQSRDYEILYHQTRREFETSIMRDGLKAARPELGNSTVQLFEGETFASLQPPDQEEFIKGFTTYYPLAYAFIGKGQKRIGVIIAIPKMEGQHKQNWHETPYNQIFKQNSQEDRNVLPYVIPRNYIWGIVRVEEEQVIQNPNFKPEPLVSAK